MHLPYAMDGKSFADILIEGKEQSGNVSYGYYRNGISLRTDTYRFTRYFREKQPDIELYNMETDPYETVNIADDFPETIRELMPLWEAGNTGLYE